MKVLYVPTVTVRSRVSSKARYSVGLLTADGESQDLLKPTLSSACRPLLKRPTVYGWSGARILMNLRIASLVILASGLIGSPIVFGCEQCHRAHAKSCGCENDKSGLLYRVDSLLGAFHSKVSKACKSVKGCDQGDGCDHEPSCGCSQVQAPAPTCGCEAAPSCGCSADGGSSQQHVYQTAPAYPPSQYPAAPYNAPTPIPSHGHTDPYIPTPAPAPARLPDAVVDPFQDEAVRNSPRRIQARPINYSRPSGSPASSRPSIRPPVGTYGVQFNDQAMFRYRVSGQASEVAVAPTNRPVSPQSRQVIRASSVRPAQEPARLQSSPAVRHLRSDDVQPATGAGQGSANPVRPASVQQPQRNSYYNPLRS